MEDKENIVWHYTKLDVLEKMLLKDRINIRFVNARFKNDPSEGLLLKEILKKYEKELKLDNLEDDSNRIKYIEDSEEILNYNYVFSTTYLADSMIFWNKEYAGPDGIAIGFDKNNNNFDFNIRFKFELAGSELFENVIYIPNPETRDIDEYVLEDIGKKLYEFHDKYKEFNKPGTWEYLVYFNWLGNFITSYSNIYKHKSWEDEKEARIILLNDSEIYQKEGELNAKTECIGNRLVKTCYKDFSKDFCKKIILGPNCKEEHIRYIKDYLRDNEYDIEISQSDAYKLEYKTSNSKELLKSKPTKADWDERHRQLANYGRQQ